MESNDRFKKKVFKYFDTNLGESSYLETVSSGWLGYYIKENDEWYLLVGAEKSSPIYWFWDGSFFSSMMEFFSLSPREFGEYLKEYLKINKGETRIKSIY